MSEIESQDSGSDIDVDSLLSDISSPNDESMTDPGAKPQQDAAQQAIQEFSFKTGGREVKAPIDKILRWAEQGYDAPNRIGELNKTLESYKSKEQQFKELQQKYGPVDEYVRQNPDFWNHVTQSYEQQMAQAQQNPLHPVVGELQKRLEGLEGIAQSFQAERQQAQAQQEDTQYMSELSAIQKQYPSIDLSTPDESGKSLEYKVLEYANQNGIKKFTTAFRDFYHDELVKRASEEAKEKVINDKQSKSKLGILGISATPTRRVSDSVKGKSYNDLTNEALAELGLN